MWKENLGCLLMVVAFIVIIGLMGQCAQNMEDNTAKEKVGNVYRIEVGEGIYVNHLEVYYGGKVSDDKFTLIRLLYRNNVVTTYPITVKKIKFDGNYNLTFEVLNVTDNFIVLKLISIK